MVTCCNHPSPTSKIKNVSDLGEEKLEQKALKQAKQKKSKSAEFLMAKEKEQEEEENGMMKGIVNPVFLSGEEEDEQSCGRQRDGGREIGDDGQDSTLAAHQQQMKLEALATTRGNEGARNYFDPWATVGADPRQRGMSMVGVGDELELKFMHEDEKGLYEKISRMLNEEASTVIDLPGSFEEERPEAVAARVLQARWRDQLREKLEKREELIPHYVEQLKEHVQDDMIPVGRAAMEQDECTAEEKEWARKRRVMAVLRGNTKESYSIRVMEQEEAALQDRLYAAFQRSERRLLNSLRQRQAEVIAQYGEFTEISEPLAIGSDFPWQVEWTRTPQQMEVCVVCLRAVREKLSRGMYSVCVSLHSGLGGPALHWSRLKEQQWMRVTKAVEHRGRVCDMELLINQNLHVVLPASCDLLPSTVLMFRILSMPSKQCAVSAVVAWGAFPVCDCSLTLIQGRFRTPLLRGCPSSAIDQFGKIEQLLSADLDNWLCNLYFQVRKIQQKDQEVCECNANEVTIEESPPDISTSTCSLTSLAGKNPVGILPVLQPASEKAKGGTQTKIGKQNQPFSKITSQSGCDREREVRASVITEDHHHFSFSLQSQQAAPLYSVVHCGPLERLHMVWRMLPAELGLSGNPRPSFRQLTLFSTLIFLTWFPRLYLHYCSQWLYLHARNIPVNRFHFHAHTVDLVYQSSLLRTLEELLLVLLGPLTLNAAMFLLLLIRWLCQLVFGSTPSFLSKLIMALGVWTVLDPLAVFTVDAVLGHLSYSADKPVADAAKLYWHFHRLEQSGTAGILITVFLYTVHIILSSTMFYIYLLRFHNDGRMLDVYLRLHSPERAFFIPDDFEVSNQELSNIVKQAEQWRGFSGERRKVAVYDYIWTQEESAGCKSPGAVPTVLGETSSHVSIYTLYLSGQRHLYRHFLRQPSGAIIELIEDLESVSVNLNVQCQKTGQKEVNSRMKGSKHALRERKRKNRAWRCNRVGPLSGSGYETN
ncbi:hypothetical protein HF521_010809 [Silurus meridionalis]|uniref:Orofacial cleft 1 candidate gene 1 protein n=3 Tax=Silurus meridionalis TaxID=175797 RepID=A0A8T0AHC1_SILME|nr:hypothetical protein HF521_010809 [Silurus meridionalis]